MKQRKNSTMQIKQLKNTVSWVKSFICISEIENWKDDSLQHQYNCFLIQTDQDTVLNGVFCDSDTFWNAVNLIEKTFNRQKCWLFVEDRLSKKDIEAFLFKNYKQIIPFFMNTESAIEYNEIVISILDGIDIEKSFASGRLTMEWET